jgi:hypothetical protein
MTIERLEEIFSDENLSLVDWTGDNTYQGLQIIAKYIDPNNNTIITGAEHDVMYSVEGEYLIDAGLTEEDAIKLRDLNWSYYDGGLFCYV